MKRKQPSSPSLGASSLGMRKGFVTINPSLMAQYRSTAPLSASAAATTTAATSQSSTHNNNKSKNTNNGPSSSAATTNDLSETEIRYCKFWAKNSLSIEECCYMINRQEQYPMLFICEAEEMVMSLADVLRQLLQHSSAAVPVLAANLKSNRNQFQKNIKISLPPNGSNASNNSFRCVLCISKHLVSFCESCLPNQMQLKTIVHIGIINKFDFVKRLELIQRQSSTSSSTNDVEQTKQIVICEASDVARIISLSVANRSKEQSKQSNQSKKGKETKTEIEKESLLYEYPKQWMALVQGRVSTTKKLVAAIAEGANTTADNNSNANSNSNNRGRDDDSIEAKRLSIAHKINSLKSKLKVLLSSKLIGCANESFESPNETKTTNAMLAAETAIDSIDASSSSSNSGSSNKYNSLLPQFERVLQTYQQLLPQFLQCPKSEANAKTVRQKMLLLGMITENVKADSLHDKAEMGRALAITRWMDGKTGYEVGAPWGSERCGASCDCMSRRAQQIVLSCRQFVARKAMKQSQRPINSNNNGSSSSGSNTSSIHHRSKKVIKKHLEQSLAPRSLRGPLRDQVTMMALGWHPNHHVSNPEEWAIPWSSSPSSATSTATTTATATSETTADYGKACGHNEVAMFVARPFAPMEVVNTHLCSALSPAPGNAGYDGCLEFLRAQCTWFRRPLSLWDNENFYYFNETGKVFVLRKESFFVFPVKFLSQLISQIRYLTIEADGKRDICSSLEISLLCSCLAKGAIALHPLLAQSGRTKIQKLIVSYLL